MSSLDCITIEEQIQKLKDQNLIIKDEDSAAEYLSLYGYSNLIKSYRDPYIYKNDGKLFFRSGITFDQVCSLYFLDKNLRNGVIAAMLDLEEIIKEAAADVVANSFGVKNTEYLEYKNYQNKKKKKKQFSLTSIINKMNEAVQSDKDPIKHFRDKYQFVPPWILFKSVYFSTIVNFIDQFKVNERKMIVHKLYRNQSVLSDEEQWRLLLDTLFVALEYRNLAAHGARIYNHKCSYQLRSNRQLFNNVSISGGFDLLLFLLSFLDYKEPLQLLKNSLDTQVNRHCNHYPQDVTYLAQILHINISQKTYVYMAPNSKIYHYDPYCSGLKNPNRMELNDALNNNYIPCKRCVKK